MTVENPTGGAESASDERVALINNLLFEAPGSRRYTLDNPILPMVWLMFAAEPFSQHELILTTTSDLDSRTGSANGDGPDVGVGTGAAAAILRERLFGMRHKHPEIWNPDTAKMAAREPARVSYIPGHIAARLYFDELLRVVLPMTPWWHETYDVLRRLEHRTNAKAAGEAASWESFPRPAPGAAGDHRREDIVDALILTRRDIDPQVNNQFPTRSETTAKAVRNRYLRRIPFGLLWFVRLGGVLAHEFTKPQHPSQGDAPIDVLARELRFRRGTEIETSGQRRRRVGTEGLDQGTARAAYNRLTQALETLYQDWSEPNDDNSPPSSSASTSAGSEFPKERHIWRVSKNRRVHLAVANSALTVKADAARSLFDISCQNITWAVLDSGIDGHHPAFKNTSDEHEQQRRAEIEAARERGDDVAGLAVLPPRGSLPIECLDSRVVRTLDFTNLRELLDYDLDYHDDTETDGNDLTKLGDAARKRHDKVVHKVAARLSFGECRCGPDNTCEPEDEAIERAAEFIDSLRRRIKKRQDISWADLEQAIEVAEPPTPATDHGTHVAGILGADWIRDDDDKWDHLPLAQRPRQMTGICPDIKLIDVRVFRQDGLTDEFELVAALQYLRWLNSRAGTMQVHGANISLSLIHEVRRFACGQTPVCQECNESTALGMTIVAAAGNRGFEQDSIDAVRSSDGYREVSITDPGNADKVITVGATHNRRPHEYGVSYFSSRGPTGDGRLKPDLVAPGEKIEGPIPNDSKAYMDGTSMAAPHVSGAAALLMARHTELIGQPERIKEVLCSTATDLGRERYFQGHGLVDILRALQAV